MLRKSVKITSIETIPIRVPIKPEFAIRSGRGGAQHGFTFLAGEGAYGRGLTGIGEASCTPRWSGEDQFTGAHLIRTYLEPLLLGENPVEWSDSRPGSALRLPGNYSTESGGGNGSLG